MEYGEAKVILRNIIGEYNLEDLQWRAVEKAISTFNKIEQGTLIELPCKVGDTVYVINQDWDEDCKDFYYIDDDKFSFYLFDWWGVTVFLTREEAEKKLEELQNG